MFWVILIIIVFVIIIAITKSRPKENFDNNRFININTTGKETLLFELTGVHVPERMRYISGFVKQSDSVTLEFEPNNRYDENAIMVLHGGVNIGYVPSFETEEVKKFVTKYEYYALVYKKEINMGYLYMEIGLIQK